VESAFKRESDDAPDMKKTRTLIVPVVAPSAATRYRIEAA
jgi:hypothetical protein